MPERRPAFQCYASDDVLANGDVAELSHEAFGLFFRLYCRAWNEEGLPNDPDRLARWARLTRDQWDALWGEMAHLWFLSDDGRWLNAGQEIKRQRAIAYVESRSANGSKGGRPKGSTKKPHVKHMVSDEKHMKSNGKAKKSSSSSFSTSSSTSGEEIHTILPPEGNGNGKAPPAGAVAPDRMKSNQLLGAWVNRQRRVLGKSDYMPSEGERGRYGAAAKRICEAHPSEEVIAAFHGMDSMWPHAPPKNEPWTLETMEKKFASALEASMNHPEVVAAREASEMANMLEGL